MPHILITGCAGFIGSHLTEKLLAEGHQVTGLDNFDPFYAREHKEANLQHAKQNPAFAFVEGDIADQKTWDSLSVKPDAVIHLAAKAGVLPSLKDPSGYLRTNVSGTQLLLEWMRKADCDRLVFGSSSSVYGNTSETPFHEKMDVSRPISNYAFTKVACETLIRTYHELYGLNAVNLRFFTVIGERQRPDLAVNKFVRMIRNGEAVTMYGDGTTARDYTYVGDIVSGIGKALSWILDQDKAFETVNLGNHSPVNLLEMIHTVYRVLGQEPNIEQLPMQKGDVQITYANVEKAGRLFGYEPTTSFEQGVRKFVDWKDQQAKS